MEFAASPDTGWAFGVLLVLLLTGGREPRSGETRTGLSGSAVLVGDLDKRDAQGGGQDSSQEARSRPTESQYIAIVIP